jgi:hypothetical protein
VYDVEETEKTVKQIDGLLTLPALEKKKINLTHTSEKWFRVIDRNPLVLQYIPFSRCQVCMRTTA